jgi:hypothetical protein
LQSEIADLLGCCTTTVRYHLNGRTSYHITHPEKSKEAKRRWYEKNKKHKLAQNKQWLKDNSEWAKANRDKPENKKKQQDYRRKWYLENREEKLAKNNEWRKNNPEKDKEYRNKPKAKETNKKYNKKYRKLPQNKLRYAIRACTHRIFEGLKVRKSFSSLLYLGCSLEELESKFESEFTKDMNWENHKRKGWHVDHIIPVSWFVENYDDPYFANHHSNLQPLWGTANLSKNDDVDEKLLKTILNEIKKYRSDLEA